MMKKLRTHFQNISKINIILFSILLSSFCLAAPASKIELYKNVSPQYIEGDTLITYIVTIINGNNSEGNYTIHDNMEQGIFEDVNITSDGNGTFACDYNSSREEELVCNLILPGGAAAHLIYNLTAPPIGMQIENTVRVTEDDSSTTLAEASVTVTVSPSYAEEIAYNRDICYVPPTADQVKQCLESGQFLYGPDCLSEVTIINTSDKELYNLHVFKAYSSPVTTEECYTLEGKVLCAQDTDLNTTLHRDSSLYFKDAFEGVLDYTLGNVSPDTNRTVVDLNTEPEGLYTDFQYIALIGQYNLDNDDDDTDTIEEYIYSCDAITSGAIVQETSGGVNDVNLKNNDFTAEDTTVAEIISYPTYNKVGTKIVNQEFLLGITYLDSDKSPAVYNGALEDKDNPKTISASVVLQWKSYDSGTEEALWSGELVDGTESLITYTAHSNDVANTRPYPIIDEAFRNGEILVKLVDYPAFLTNLDTPSACVNNSNFTGNLCNVPACFDSAQQIFNVFPIERYPLVATCVYGDGGAAAPCDSQAYNGHCGGVNKTISPAKYNEYDGCAQCLADAVAPVESSNPFSSRPYSYSLAVPEWQNELYQAGVNYPIELNATTADPTVMQSNFYTTKLEGDHAPTVISSIKLDANASLTCSYYDSEPQLIDFVNGVAGGPISYSNVGDVNLTIMDQNWTSIDWDGVDGDPECILDSNATDPTQDELHLGRVGCKLITSKLMRFVPFTFDMDANLSNHNTIRNFTYLNDFNGTGGVTDMAASLNINIAAVNADGNTTTNYIDGCYAKDNNLSLTFDPFNISPTNSLTHMLYYNVIDDNKSDIFIPLPRTNIISLPEALKSTSANFTPAGNGTANFEYKLNFNRSIDKEVQAFAMNLTDVNMTDTDNVEGNQTGITGQTAIMHYAKAKPSVGIGLTYTSKTEVALTPILIDVYCDPGGVFSIDYDSCADLGIALSTPWAISAGHNSDAGDGNITLKVIDPPVDVVEGSGTPSLAYTKISIIADGKDDNLTVNRGPNPTFPLTVNIELDATSDAWLIHNPFSLPIYPSPFYKVKFISPSIWAGPGGTGSVVDTDVNTNSNKRSNW